MGLLLQLPLCLVGKRLVSSEGRAIKSESIRAALHLCASIFSTLVGLGKGHHTDSRDIHANSEAVLGSRFLSCCMAFDPTALPASSSDVSVP